MKDHARWEGNEGSSSCQEPPLEGGLARQDAVAGPASGSSSSGEEKRLMAARLQKAANSANCNTDVLAYLEQGADPSAAGEGGRRFSTPVAIPLWAPLHRAGGGAEVWGR